MKVKRIAILGFGSIGERHLRLARQKVPDADIRVLSRSVERPVPEGSNAWLTSYSDLKQFSPQVAIIATPAPFHLDAAKQMADMNTHVLVEKFISDKTDGVQGLIEQFRARNLCLLVGYNLRFSASLRRLRALLSEKLIGEVYSARVEVGQYLPPGVWAKIIARQSQLVANSEVGFCLN